MQASSEESVTPEEAKAFFKSYPDKRLLLADSVSELKNESIKFDKRKDEPILYNTPYQKKHLQHISLH